MSWVVKYEISGLKERKEENKNGERGGDSRKVLGLVDQSFTLAHIYIVGFIT